MVLLTSLHPRPENIGKLRTTAAPQVVDRDELVQVLTGFVAPTLKPHSKYIIYVYCDDDGFGPRIHHAYNTRAYQHHNAQAKTPHAEYQVVVLLLQRLLQIVQAASQLNHLTGHRPAPLGKAHVDVLT